MWTNASWVDTNWIKNYLVQKPTRPTQIEEFVETTITDLSAFWIFLFVCLFDLSVLSFVVYLFVCSVICCLFVRLFSFFVVLLFVCLSVLCVLLFSVLCLCLFVSFSLFCLFLFILFLIDCFVCLYVSFCLFFAFFYMCLVFTEIDLIMFLLYQLISSYVHETWNWC